MIKNTKLKIGFSIILTVAVLASGLLFGSLQAATTNQYDKFELTIDEVKVLYHKRINDLFNSKLKLMKQGDKGPGSTEIPKGDECSENNYSTFCLAITAADEYEKYAEALRKRKRIIPAGSTELTVAGIQSAAQTRLIDIELDGAQRALDMALATYNEMLPVYRMHEKFQKLIEALTKYNKKLSEYRKEVEKLPPKFIDATTASCT